MNLGLVNAKDPDNVRRTFQFLQRELGYGSSPKFVGLTLTGLTATRLVQTNASKGLASVANLTGWIAGTANEINVADDGDGTVTIGIVDPLIVGKGGTGAATLTDHGLLLGSGTDAITPLGAATNGQLPIGSTGADPVLAALTAGAGIDVTNAAGSITVASTITQYTDALARAAISETITGIDYNNTTGVFSLTAGYVIPTTTQETNWTAAYTHSGLTSGNPHSVTKAEVGLTNVEDTALSTWVGSANITTLGIIATGTWNATTIGISKGGTGQTTAQAAIDALTQVSAATNEHILTKDTATGNAIFKAAPSGDNYTVKVDAGATADYIGAASSDGVLRTGTGLSYTDGGNFVTLALSVANAMDSLTSTYNIAADTTWESIYDAGPDYVSVTLPAAGTYLLLAQASGYILFSAGSNECIYLRLYNQTDAAEVPNSAVTVVQGNSVNTPYQATATLFTIYTVAASKEIRLQAYRTAATWTGAQLFGAVTRVAYFRIA